MKSTKLIQLIGLAIVLLLSSCNKTDEIAHSQDVSNYFKVERLKDTKEYVVRVTQPSGSWEILTGTTPQNINQKLTAGKGAQTITLASFSTTTRMYFRYVWEKNSSVTASERLLPMEGTYNVRDLGGYKTVNGKIVKWGKVFRSGDLNKLTSNDLGYLTEIAIKSIVDLRDNTEREQAPDKIPSTLVKTYSFPIDADSVVSFANVTTLEQSEKLLVEGNKFFVTDCQEQYKSFFQTLMNEDDAPLLFHCSAGKDRVGFASALFLASLGVDRETIIEDYLLSGEYVKEKYASYVQASPILAPVFGTRREYIMAVFEVIDANYGGIESFLTKQLGVDINKIRVKYTE